jgi:hypothetical protein
MLLKPVQDVYSTEAQILYLHATGPPHATQSLDHFRAGGHVSQVAVADATDKHALLTWRDRSA